MNKIVKPINYLKGEIKVPGDKSISHRVVFIGSISKGKTEGKNFLEADDCIRTVSAFKNMGVDINIQNGKVTILGNGLKSLKKSSRDLYLGNSGTTMRILPGILAGQDFESVLTGDKSLSNRPMQRIIEPLVKMGVKISAKSPEGKPPLLVRGGEVKAIDYFTKVASAQVKSCILFAGLYANSDTSITEPFVSRNHTERMLEFFGAKISRKSFTISLEAQPELTGKEFFIPGDISSAAFFMAGACMLRGSEVTIKDVGLNETRTGFLDVLLRMGADITILNRKETVEPYGDIRVKYAPLKATVIEKGEVPLLIDEIPILSVLASKADGTTIIKGVSELRVKETDRIMSMTENLKSMGVEIKSIGDDLSIEGNNKRLEEGTLKSFKDHRTAMSMAIASLSASSECEIKDADCINTSFPDFFKLLDHLKK